MLPLPPVPQRERTGLLPNPYRGRRQDPVHAIRVRAGRALLHLANGVHGLDLVCRTDRAACTGPGWAYRRWLHDWELAISLLPCI